MVEQRNFSLQSILHLKTKIWTLLSFCRKQTGKLDPCGNSSLSFLLSFISRDP